ncbi:MAG: trypsin-like peptidase domain-containing protein [Candidatus Marinimicrobia bacterium]|nr:trypsin-like peptidase domain-containing protein [Candidatus Neomarinimicrobiota bacterium]
MKKIPVNFIFFVILTCFTFTRGDDLQDSITISRRNALTNAIETVSPAVASINVIAYKNVTSGYNMENSIFGLLFPEAHYRQKVKNIGSGVIISADGYIVTNAHVVANATEITVTLQDGNNYSARLAGVDDVADVALIKIDDIQDFSFAKLGDSDDIIIGEWCIALGNPFGLFDVNKKPTATVGIISGTNLDFGARQDGTVYQDMIQTDAAINHGNSGGPLINAEGKVIGINTFIFTGSNIDQGSIGLGFAIPINRVKEIVLELKQYGKVDRYWETGLSVQTLDPYIAKVLKLEVNNGVIVTEVKPGSAGEKAGILVGDVLLQVNGEIISSAWSIKKVITENFYKAGDILDFKIVRENRIINKKLRLEK